MDLLSITLACGLVCLGQTPAPTAPPVFPPDMRLLPPVKTSPAAPPETFPASEQDFVTSEIVTVEPIKIWEGSFELGVNGTEGNSQTLNFRFGFDAKRETDFSILSVDLDCHRNTSDNIETANRAFLEWRYERLCKDSPWTWYLHGTVDYDQFQVYDALVTMDTGLGYSFIKNDTTSLTARFGGGVSHEIGGTRKTYVPELLYGLDFKRKLSERQKFAASMEYAPDASDFSIYRLRTKISWQVILDEEINLSMKVNFLDRYFSNSGLKDPNDVDYSVVLLWGF